MSEPLSIETLSQTVKALQEQVEQMQASLVKAGLMTVEEGITGVYEGEYMVTAEGQRHIVPANYASKTMLVSGDELRMVVAADGGQARFKQIAKAERLKAEGLLAKKDGKFEVLTDQGSFKVLAAAVNHYDGQPGDKVMVQYPRQHVKGSWAAIERITKGQVGVMASPVVANAVMPTANAIQIKHAPAPVVTVEEIVKPSQVNEAKVEVAEKTAVAPKQPAKDKPKSEAAKPARKPQSSKPAGGRGERQTGSKATGSRNNAGSARSSANKPAPQKPRSDRPASPSRVEPATEPSLPLDKGQIMPMVEFDDDELM